MIAFDFDSLGYIMVLHGYAYLVYKTEQGVHTIELDSIEDFQEGIL